MLVNVLLEDLVGVTVAVEVADALNVPEAVSDPEIDCVLVLVLVAVDVIDDDAVAVVVEVAVAVGELETSSANSCVPISVSKKTMYWLFITLRTASTIAIFFIVHLIGRSASTVALYCFQSFSKIAKAILRISPVVASASAAVSSGKLAIGTVMFVPSSDQLAIQVVGVLSNAIA